MDVSEQIVAIRRQINQLEMLNANPDINGRKLIADTAVEVARIAQEIVVRTVNYAE